MAISFSNLGVNATPDLNSGADATSYATASWTPPTSGLILAFVHGARAGTATPDTPTMSGNGVTWTQIGTTLSINGGVRGLSLFAANASGSSTGATTIDFGANTQLGCIVSFLHADGVDLASGVAAAIVQNVSNSGTATSGSVTLAAAAHADNRPVAGFYHNTNETKTPRTNWTEADDLTGAGHARALETQFRSDAFETTASATWTTSSAWGGIAVELKALVSGTAYTLTADSGAFTHTGTAATLKFGRRIVAATNAFSHTGIAAALKFGRRVVAAQGSFVLTGTSASVRATRRLVAASGTLLHTGTSATLARGRRIAAASVSFVLSGTAATFARGRRVTANSASFVLTGTSATLNYGRRLVAASAAFTLAGTAAAVKFGRVVVASSATFSVTGTAAVVAFGRRLVAAGGTFALSGAATALRLTRRLVAALGAFVLTGDDASLTYEPVGAYTLPAEDTSYLLTGASATLKIARRVVAAQSSYVVTGTSATFAIARRLSASAGSLTLSGSAVSLRRGRMLAADAATWSLAGQATTLRVARRVEASAVSYTLVFEDAALVYVPFVVYVLQALSGVYWFEGQAATLVWSAYEPPATPSSRLVIIAADVRRHVVTAENRTVVVPVQSRITFVS